MDSNEKGSGKIPEPFNNALEVTLAEAKQAQATND